MYEGLEGAQAPHPAAAAAADLQAPEDGPREQPDLPGLKPVVRANTKFMEVWTEFRTARGLSTKVCCYLQGAARPGPEDSRPRPGLASHQLPVRAALLARAGAPLQRRAAVAPQALCLHLCSGRGGAGHARQALVAAGPRGVQPATQRHRPRAPDEEDLHDDPRGV